MFFSDWQSVVRVVVVGCCAYVALVVLLRTSGKRTLSKLNAFDLVVTVALGSTLATIILSKDVALAEGVVAFAVLIGLQYLVAWAAVRSPTFGRMVKSQPTLVLYRGEVLRDAARRERLTEEEVVAAVRAQGFSRIEDAEAVVLETDGKLSVLGSAREGPATALAKVPRPDGSDQ